MIYHSIRLNTTEPVPPTAPRAIGREPIWVDLEAAPKISPDSPPDLKQHVDAVPPPAKAATAAATADGGSSSGGAAGGSAAGSSSKGGEAAASAAPPPGAPAGGHKHHAHHGHGHGHGHKKGSAAAVTDAARHLQLTDVEARADEVISLVCAALVGAPPAAAAGAASGGDATEAAYVLERLKADVEVALSAFKNAAYTAGYSAAKGEVVAAATKRYA